MPPATQNGMSSSRATRAPSRGRRAPVWTGGDVVEDELVRAFVAIARRKLKDVADDAVVAEANALDDLTVAHVQTGDYAFGKNGSQLL